MTGEVNQALLMRQARVKKIPPGWKLFTVGEACSIRNDLRKPISLEEREKIKGQYPYYGPTGVLNYINEYRLDGRFALIGEDGDHFLKYRSWSQTQLVEGKANVNNHAHVIESTSICSVEWFRIFFEHRDLTDFLTRQGAGRFKLNKATLQKLPILIPPIHEQKRIAKILATWDEAIALTERAIEAKQKRKMALMQKLLTGKLRFQQFVIEDEWLPGYFVDIAEIVMGQSPDGSTYNQQCVGVPLLNGPTEFGERYPTKMQWTTSPTKFCKEGDILLCVRGSSTGRTNIADSEYCIGRGIAAIRAKSGKSITSYLEQNLIFGIQKLLSLTSGSTFPNIDKKSIGQIPIVIPSVEEQKLITTILLLADEEIQKLKQQVKQFKKQKQGLMQKLLIGEWRVAVQEAA